MSTKGKATVVKQTATILPGRTWWEVFEYTKQYGWRSQFSEDTEAEAIEASKECTTANICIIEIKIPAMTIGEKK